MRKTHLFSIVLDNLCYFFSAVHVLVLKVEEIIIVAESVRPLMVVLSWKVKFTSGIGYEQACLNECGKDVWSLRRKQRLAKWKHTTLIGELVLPIRYCKLAQLFEAMLCNFLYLITLKYFACYLSCKFR